MEELPESGEEETAFHYRMCVLCLCVCPRVCVCVASLIYLLLQHMKGKERRRRKRGGGLKEEKIRAEICSRQLRQKKKLKMK